MAEHSPTDNVRTRRIAEFVAGQRYERVPHEVRERIKLLILDSLGCAIYGARRILRSTLDAPPAAPRRPHASSRTPSPRPERVHLPADRSRTTKTFRRCDLPVRERPPTKAAQTRVGLRPA
jgi:MmgE/PrpD N-terminal domain